jgi:O-antigen/teichoic acid export membrane protein
MGIIQKQGSRSSVYIFLGFIIGAFNMLVLYPYFLSTEQIGLTRAILDTGLTLATLCTFGTIPIINKFGPYYQNYLSVKKNDLPIITFVIGLIGFSLLLLVGFYNKEFILRKLGKSPSLVEHFNVIYPFTLLFIVFTWMEAFSWTIKKTVVTNFIKETLVRILNGALIVLFGLGIVDFKTFIFLFSLTYLLPVIILGISLIKSGEWKFNLLSISSVTKRLKGRIISFSLFLFAGQFFNILAKTNDTFLIVGLKGLSDAGIFTIAVYLATIIEIPQRSILSISVPILSESWRTKNLKNINDIYTKSVSNLMLIACFLYGIILLNMSNLIEFMNLVSHKNASNFAPLFNLFLILGLGKLIDMSTGMNGAIIGTSNYWKFDFISNLVFITTAIPLNYVLIKQFGLTGLAISNLGTLLIFNFIRYLFLYYKFKFQPYQIKHLVLLISFGVVLFLLGLIPHMGNFLMDGAIRSIVYFVVFYAMVYLIKPAPELTNMFFDFLEKKNIKFLKRF